MDGYLVASDAERKHVVNATTHHAEFYFCAFFAAQAFHDLFLRHLHAGNRRIVDSNDTVASQNTHLLGRSVQSGLYHHERVFDDVELHANTLERALQGFCHGLCLLGRSVRRVGIEFLEHASDSILHEFLLVDGIYIEIGDGHFGHLEFPYRRVITQVQVELGRGR